MILCNTCHVEVCTYKSKERMIHMAYSAKSQKTYNDKCYRFSIKFVPSEKEEVRRFKEYLKESGETANSYIKELIKKDLNEKGIQ